MHERKRLWLRVAFIASSANCCPLVCLNAHCIRMTHHNTPRRSGTGGTQAGRQQRTMTVPTAIACAAASIQNSPLDDSADQLEGSAAVSAAPGSPPAGSTQTRG